MSSAAASSSATTTPKSSRPRKTYPRLEPKEFDEIVEKQNKQISDLVLLAAKLIEGARDNKPVIDSTTGKTMNINSLKSLRKGIRGTNNEFSRYYQVAHRGKKRAPSDGNRKVPFSAPIYVDSVVSGFFAEADLGPAYEVDNGKVKELPRTDLKKQLRLLLDPKYVQTFGAKYGVKLGDKGNNMISTRAILLDLFSIHRQRAGLVAKASRNEGKEPHQWKFSFYAADDGMKKFFGNDFSNLAARPAHDDAKGKPIDVFDASNIRVIDNTILIKYHTRTRSGKLTNSDEDATLGPISEKEQSLLEDQEVLDELAREHKVVSDSKTANSAGDVRNTEDYQKAKKASSKRTKSPRAVKSPRAQSPQDAARPKSPKARVAKSPKTRVAKAR